MLLSTQIHEPLSWLAVRNRIEADDRASIADDHKLRSCLAAPHYFKRVAQLVQAEESRGSV